MDEISIAFLVVYIVFFTTLWMYFSLFDRVVPKPGKVSFHISQGEEDMLKFCVCLPPKGASDVQTRELCVSINDAEPVKKLVDADTLHVDEFVGNHGDVVTGYLVDIDGAGNVSAPRLFKFDLVDTIAPPMPGDIGLMVLEQVEPTPVDPVDPVDTPE